MGNLRRNDSARQWVGRLVLPSAGRRRGSGSGSRGVSSCLHRDVVGFGLGVVLLSVQMMSSVRAENVVRRAPLFIPRRCWRATFRKLADGALSGRGMCVRRALFLLDACSAHAQQQEPCSASMKPPRRGKKGILRRVSFLRHRTAALNTFALKISLSFEFDRRKELQK